MPKLLRISWRTAGGTFGLLANDDSGSPGASARIENTTMLMATRVTIEIRPRRMRYCAIRRPQDAGDCSDAAAAPAKCVSGQVVTSRWERKSTPAICKTTGRNSFGWLSKVGESYESTFDRVKKNADMTDP